MENWDEYFKNTEIIVHAGGMSERWHPVTQGKIPKVLTEIGKTPRPIIDWTILPYAKMGVKKIFVSLWHNPEKIIDHCTSLQDSTGIRFVFLKEIEKRMGRAGVIKFYIEKKVLDKDKPKINIGAADILNISIEKFARFQFEGLSQGFSATLIGSTSGVSQFDRIIFDPTNNKVLKMDVERVINLTEGKCANTGTAYLDSGLNDVFLEISENDLPIDWEQLSRLFANARCFSDSKVYDNWIPLKTPYDYKRVKDMNFEKWFGIKSAEDYLGLYKPSSL